MKNINLPLVSQWGLSASGRARSLPSFDTKKRKPKLGLLHFTSLPSTTPLQRQSMPSDTQKQEQQPAAADAAAAAPAKASKHSHSQAQAAPAPRKVRFNVGEYYRVPGSYPVNLDYSDVDLMHRRACRNAIPGARRSGRGRVRYRMQCDPPPDRPQGGHQENRPFRPFNVLSPHPTRTQTPQVPLRGRCQRERVSSSTAT